MKVTTVSTGLMALLALSTIALAQGPGRREFGGPGGGFGRPGFGFGGGPVVTGQPYSGVGVSTSTRTLANGNVITQSTCTKVYRDSSGRTRQEETPNSSTCSATPTIVVIRDPAAGVEYRINAANNTYQQFTFKAPPSNAARPSARRPGLSNSGELQTTDLGTQPIPGTGLMAQGTQSVRTIPAGQIGNSQPIVVSSTTWRSPDLQIVLQRSSDDPRMGKSSYQLTNVSTAVPDPSLFTLPAGLTLQEGHGFRQRPNQ